MGNETHIADVQALLRERELDVLVICNCGRGAWDHWLGLRSDLPVLPPFHRNTMLLVFPDQQPAAVSALCPHPTDPEQYPLFCAEMLDGRLERKRLGTVNGDCLKQRVWEQIEGRFGCVELVDLTDELMWMQARNTPDETDRMVQAARLYDQLFTTVPMILQPECLEREAVTQIRYRALQLGADAEDLGLLTQVWLTSGAENGQKTGEPLVWPGRRITWGDRINVQVAGAVPEGVYGALGRCYVMGQASEETRRYWNLTVRAQDLAASKLKPGRPLHDAMDAVAELLREENVKVPSGLWLHGTGYSWQGLPRNIDASCEKPLEENMTLAVGVPVQIGETPPYCCMDIVRVTAGGGVRLSATPRDLVELV